MAQHLIVAPLNMADMCARAAITWLISFFFFYTACLFFSLAQLCRPQTSKNCYFNSGGGTSKTCLTMVKINTSLYRGNATWKSNLVGVIDCNFKKGVN